MKPSRDIGIAIVQVDLDPFAGLSGDGGHLFGSDSGEDGTIGGGETANIDNCIEIGRGDKYGG